MDKPKLTITNNDGYSKELPLKQGLDHVCVVGFEDDSWGPFVVDLKNNKNGLRTRVLRALGLA